MGPFKEGLPQQFYSHSDISGHPADHRAPKERIDLPADEAVGKGMDGIICIAILKNAGMLSLKGEDHTFAELAEQHATSRPQPGDPNYAASVHLSEIWVRKAITLMDRFSSHPPILTEGNGETVWTAAVLDATDVNRMLVRPGRYNTRDVAEKANGLRELASTTWVYRHTPGVYAPPEVNPAENIPRELAEVYLPVWYTHDAQTQGISAVHFDPSRYQQSANEFYGRVEAFSKKIDPTFGRALGR